MKQLYPILAAVLVLGNIQCSKNEEIPAPSTSTGPALIDPYVMTLAGSSIGYLDGTGSAAAFSGPSGLAFDLSGNLVVADGYNNRIRKIDSTGNVTTFAGSGSVGFNDGNAKTASFFNPAAVVTDPSGNIFVCDQNNDQIRKITPTGVVSTFAGARASNPAGARLNAPSGTATDLNGNVYVADQWNHLIRKFTADGRVTTIGGSTAGYGDGNTTTSKFQFPAGVAVDKVGNVFVADLGNNRIRKIAVDGTVSTIAGDGSVGGRDGISTSASFNKPIHIAVDDSSNLYVTDFDGHKIRKITPSGRVSTIAGTGSKGRKDGPLSIAEFNKPCGITIDKKGNIYVGDVDNNTVRKIVFK